MTDPERAVTTRDDLIAAKALIDTPEKWCKGAFRDRHGRICAITAISSAAISNYREMRGALFDQIIQPRRKPIGVGAFNDLPTTTHADVMALFDRALASQPVQP